MDQAVVHNECFVNDMNQTCSKYVHQSLKTDGQVLSAWKIIVVFCGYFCEVWKYFCKSQFCVDNFRVERWPKIR